MSIRFASLVAFVSLGFVGTASAVQLSGAVADRAGFSLGNYDSRSYDGPSFDAFAPFASFTTNQLQQVGSFSGAPSGSKLEFFLISEVAAYDGVTIPGVGDSFGVLSSTGNFIPAFSFTDGPGASSELFQGAGDEFTFALNSPEGFFSAKDEDNPDGKAHIIAMTVDKAGVVNIDRANLYGAMLSFNLQVGDIILFNEDLLSSINSLNNLPSDFDYNDLVVVVRTTAVPEPATCALLLTGLGALGARRRRRIVS